ncbi:MAG: hypothetical protein AAB583_01235 [Patescibacteria group bacterium]
MENSNQTSQAQQPVNSTPPSVNNSSGSKLIPIILGIAVVVIIAIGAYALGTKQSQPVVQNTIQTTPIPSPVPTSSSIVLPTIDPSITANWKTYIDTTFPFSIKYPSTWSLKVTKDALDIPTINLRHTEDSSNIYPTELFIGGPAVYSTSGAICANTTCEKNGSFTISIGSDVINTPIVQVMNKNEASYYRFQFGLPKIFQKKLEGYSSPTVPTVTANYYTPEDKNQIDQILSTFRFSN